MTAAARDAVRGAAAPPTSIKAGPFNTRQNRARVSGESRVFSEARICPLNVAVMVGAAVFFFVFFLHALSR